MEKSVELLTRARFFFLLFLFFLAAVSDLARQRRTEIENKGI
jgi:hypothetical protein